MRSIIRSAAFALALVCGAAFVGGHSAEARTSFSLSVGVPFGYYGGPHWGGGYGGGYYAGHWGGGHRGYRGWRGRDHFSFGFYAPMYSRPYYRPYYPRAYAPVYARPYYRPHYGPIYSLGLFPAYVGDTLSYEARGYYHDAYRRALSAPIGEAVEWSAGGTRGTVATTRDGWAGQRYCREFRQDVVIDGQTQEAYGTACQTPDGDWQLVENQE
jgi:hypothetical protein